MRTCAICKFPVEVDDQVFHGPNAQTICLRCYGRQTDSFMEMPKPLRRQLTEVMEAALA